MGLSFPTALLGDQSPWHTKNLFRAYVHPPLSLQIVLRYAFFCVHHMRQLQTANQLVGAPPPLGRSFRGGGSRSWRIGP